jgi:predicted house-cleaning noncanonical NTP pyrophosphatase (MazG superfamily)
MPSDNIIRPDFNTKFPYNEELAEKIHMAIEEYHNQISLAEVIGVLEIVKHCLLQAHYGDDE